MTLNLTMSNDLLKQAIAKNGRLAIDSRQVKNRLKSLLEARLTSMTGKYRLKTRTRLRAFCLALTDPLYLNHLEELIEITSSADEARVQYETHLMLFNARKSLRKT